MKRRFLVGNVYTLTSFLDLLEHEWAGTHEVCCSHSRLGKLQSFSVHPESNIDIDTRKLLAL